MEHVVLIEFGVGGMQYGLNELDDNLLNEVQFVFKVEGFSRIPQFNFPSSTRY